MALPLGMMYSWGSAMRRRVGRFLKANEGVTAIEFGMVAPPLIFLLLGIIEYSIIFHLQSLATHAGNEAARMSKTNADYCKDGLDKRTCIDNTVRKVMGAWITSDRPLDTQVYSFGEFQKFTGGVVSPSTGGGGEIVMYYSRIQWKPITPFLFNGIATDGAVNITSYALTVNEEF